MPRRKKMVSDEQNDNMELETKNTESIIEGLPKTTVDEVLRREIIKLDLGGGDHPAQGYINVDIKYYPEVDLLLDITKLENVFPPESVDGMICRDTLQCFSYTGVRRILSSWRQILKPRSKISIQVYDVNSIVKAFADGEIDFNKFRTLMYGRQRDQFTIFHNCFTEESLTALLERSGFVIQEVLHPTMRIKVVAIKAK
jgi:predicted SAM-dependent methyltransferase